MHLISGGAANVGFHFSGTVDKVVAQLHPTAGVVGYFRSDFDIREIGGSFNADFVQWGGRTEVHVHVHAGKSLFPASPSGGGRVVEGELNLPRSGKRGQAPFGFTR